MVTDLEGNPDVLRQTGIVAGNPALHPILLETIRRRGGPR